MYRFVSEEWEKFFRQTAEQVVPASKGRERRQQDAGTGGEKYGQLLPCASRVANRQRRVKMPHHKHVSLRRSAWKPIAMYGNAAAFAPFVHGANGQMRKLASESPVVIAAHGYQGSAPTEFIQDIFNPLALRSTRARRMHQIAEKHNARGLELIDEGEQFLACAEIG